MKTLRTALISAACCATLLGHAGSTAAQSSATTPTRIFVGFAAGGGADTVARIVADQMQRELGRAVIIENRPGALGRIALEAVLSAPADGNSYVLAPFSTLVFPALTQPELMKFDIQQDLAPVGVVTSFPLGLAVHASTGVNDAAQLVQWLRQNPEKAHFGTAGMGGHNHFMGLLLGNQVGVPMEVVGYKGNGPMLVDLTAGHVPMGIMLAGDMMTHTQDSNVRAIGVFTAERSPLIPNVPTFKEQGLEVLGGDAWFGLWTKAGAPVDKIREVENALELALANPEVQKRLTEGVVMQPDFQPAAKMAERLASDIALWRPVIEASGFKPGA